MARQNLTWRPVQMPSALYQAAIAQDRAAERMTQGLSTIGSVFNQYAQQRRVKATNDLIKSTQDEADPLKRYDLLREGMGDPNIDAGLVQGYMKNMLAVDKSLMDLETARNRENFFRGITGGAETETPKTASSLMNAAGAPVATEPAETNAWSSLNQIEEDIVAREAAEQAIPQNDWMEQQAEARVRNAREQLLQAGGPDIPAEALYRVDPAIIDNFLSAREGSMIGDQPGDDLARARYRLEQEAKVASEDWKREKPLAIDPSESVEAQYLGRLANLAGDPQMLAQAQSLVDTSAANAAWQGATLYGDDPRSEMVKTRAVMQVLSDLDPIISQFDNSSAKNRVANEAVLEQILSGLDPGLRESVLDSFRGGEDAMTTQEAVEEDYEVDLAKLSNEFIYTYAQDIADANNTVQFAMDELSRLRRQTGLPTEKDYTELRESVDGAQQVIDDTLTNITRSIAMQPWTSSQKKEATERLYEATGLDDLSEELKRLQKFKDKVDDEKAEWVREVDKQTRKEITEDKNNNRLDETIYIDDVGIRRGKIRRLMKQTRKLLGTGVSAQVEDWQLVKAIKNVGKGDRDWLQLRGVVWNWGNDVALNTAPTDTPDDDLLAPWVAEEVIKDMQMYNSKTPGAPIYPFVIGFVNSKNYRDLRLAVEEGKQESLRKANLIPDQPAAESGTTPYGPNIRGFSR